MTEVTTDKNSPTAPPLGMAEQIYLRQTQQKTNIVLWGIFSLLLVLVGTVIFVLPAYVNTTTSDLAPAAAPAAAVAAATAVVGISPFEEAQLLRQRTNAQNTLAAFLQLQTTLEEQQVISWSETLFNEALALAHEGDAAYSTQQFEKANTLYQSGLTMLQQINDNKAANFADFMSKANAAYTAGDAELAVQAYSQALLINGESTEAAAGMDRAQVLTQVLDLLNAGRKLQADNLLEQARDTFQQAQTLDNTHAQVSAALADVNTAIVERNFAAAMSRGYSALQAGQFESALVAFEQALAIRPGASEVSAAIGQAKDQQTFAAVTVRINAATTHEANENWQQALMEWDQALAVDPNLVTAKEGRARSNSRNNLDIFLVAAINDPLRLAAESVYTQTDQVLADAGQLSNPGPKLSQQLQQVRDFLQRVKLPTNVQLQSDGFTTVSLYGTGELGTFTAQTVSLTPGTYTAVGVRTGYRDVRQEFVVTIDGQAAVVTVACDEAI